MATVAATRRGAKCCVFCGTENPREGRYLNCLHVICVGCVREHITPDGSIDCAVCKVETLPRYPSVDLSKQLIPSQRVRNVQSASSEATPAKFCEFCEGGGVKRIASHSCNDCDGASLCDEHVEEHSRIRVFRQHDIRPLPKMTMEQDSAGISKTRERPCPLHGRHELSRGCKTCHMPVCEHCLVKGHQQHSIVPLAEMASEQRAALQKEVKTSAVDSTASASLSASYSAIGLAATLESMMTGLSDEISTVNDEATAASQQITDTFSNMRKLMQKRERDLLDKVDKLRWQHQRPLEEKLQRLTYMEEMQSPATDLAKYLCESECCDGDVVQLGALVQKKLESFKSDLEKEKQSAEQRPTLKAVTTGTVMEDFDAKLQSAEQVVEDLGVNLDQMVVDIPTEVIEGVTLTIPCSTDSTVIRRGIRQQLSASLISASGSQRPVHLATDSTTSSSDIVLCARVRPDQAGDHTLEVKLANQCRSIPFQVQNVALAFDRQRCSSNMIISGTNDRIAQVSGNAQGKYANVYGTLVYTTGQHTWRVRVHGDLLESDVLVMGVATLPESGITNDDWLCYTYGTGVTSNGYAFGSSQVKYRTEAAWWDGLILEFTFDYDHGTLSVKRDLRHSGMNVKGKQLYFCVTMSASRFRQIEIL